MNTVDYLQACKTRLNITSDYALAARLGVTRSGISQYQSGRNQMGDETAVRVAEILGIDPAQVLLNLAMERARTPETQAVWSGLMNKLQASFESLLLPVGRRPAH